jgi:hypothetical protein
VPTGVIIGETRGMIDQYTRVQERNSSRAGAVRVVLCRAKHRLSAHLNASLIPCSRPVASEYLHRRDSMILPLCAQEQTFNLKARLWASFRGCAEGQIGRRSNAA